MDDTAASAKPRSLGIRALLMLLMTVAFQLAASVLLCVAALQLLLSVATESGDDRLRGFGGALGRYLGQIADFVSFRTEDLPFPFSDWPSQPTTA
jgi:succinate-acetate transporter protein